MLGTRPHPPTTCLALTLPSHHLPPLPRPALVCEQEFKIQNMVGSCDVKFPIRLEGLASTHAVFCSVSTRPALRAA